MRDVSRRLLSAFFSLGLVFSAALAVSPADAADQRIIVTPDADYSGFDMGAPVKGVSLDECKAACLGNKECRAFTFNNKAGWCFLKSDFGALSAFAGATAGRVVSVTPVTPSLEKQRLADLTFISSSLVDEARALEGGVKRRFDPAGASYQVLRNAADNSYRQHDFETAAADYGRALAIADEDPQLWMDLSDASLNRQPQNWSDRQQAASDASAAAILAYLRADDKAIRARALAKLGAALEKREIWKASYRSYRASLALVENKQIRADYERVIAEHGFRIVSHSVDADFGQSAHLRRLLRRPSRLAAGPCRLRQCRGWRRAGDRA